MVGDGVFNLLAVIKEKALIFNPFFFFLKTVLWAVGILGLVHSDVIFFHLVSLKFWVSSCGNKKKKRYFIAHTHIYMYVCMGSTLSSPTTEPYLINLGLASYPFLYMYVIYRYTCMLTCIHM